jgi:hypothetical protein
MENNEYENAAAPLEAMNHELVSAPPAISIVECRPALTDYALYGAEFPRLYCLPENDLLPLGIPESQRYIYGRDSRQNGAECPGCHGTCTLYHAFVQRTKEMIPEGVTIAIKDAPKVSQFHCIAAELSSLENPCVNSPICSRYGPFMDALKHECPGTADHSTVAVALGSKC